MKTTLESCPRCGVVVDTRAMKSASDYSQTGDTGIYYEDQNYIWIYCPVCKEKVFTKCDD